MMRILILLAILFAAPSGTAAQMRASDFHRILVEKADFAPYELAQLEGNKPVVKPLRSDGKQEIAVIGVIDVGADSTFTLEAFRNSLAQRSDKSAISRGLFGNPPTVADLGALRLEKRDYDELRRCRPGDCDVNLTAAALEQLKTAVDWDSPDHQSAVDRFVRELLLGYVIEYLARGDRSLDEYTNRAKPFDRIRAHRALLEETPFLRELAPDLFEFISKFPEIELPDAASELRWSSIDFGLNPAIILTHTVAAMRNGHHFVINKQLYGSRYLDVSLSTAMLLTVADGSREHVFLVFTDRSRTDAIGGPFGSMARRVVASEAKSRITKILEKGRTALIADARSRSQTVADADPPRGLFYSLRWPLLAAGVTLAIILTLYFKRIRRSKWRQGREPRSK